MTTKNEIVEKMQNGIVEVTFKKKDGTQRVLVGTLVERLITNKPKGRARPEADDLVVCYDVEIDEFRSFLVPSVTNVRVLENVR